MALSVAWLCFLFLCLVALNDAFLFRSRSRRRISIRITRCDSKRNCVSCTNHKSWSGKPCRWCPRDKKCHTYGAILTNPCSTTEDVVSARTCSSIVNPIYDSSLAFKMVYLSALAYADNVAKYILKATEVASFRLVRQVTKSCAGKAKCSGFVAVSHTERAIAVAFRGSEHSNQVIVEALTILAVPKVPFQAGGKVQKYFNDAFVLIWNDLKNYVYREIRRYRHYKVWVTGHSLGGALASLASTVLLHEGRTRKNNLFLYTFGQPRVGDHQYALRHDRLVPISFRVTHFRDPAVHLPTCSSLVPGGACIAYTGGPYHHGKEIFYGNRVMTKTSPYKKCQGLPYDEDLACSNKPSVWAKCLTSELKKCIKDHQFYFGIRVGVWWKE
ncbi:lipase -like [Paramuricea clavata]|uniref:Lipase -like n=1 Tax=Paramuricea clavata TaxID=317549 RepID=A0A7D9HAZ9_PARCT|nr:lipase -like [Paramuricea clavata]